MDIVVGGGVAGLTCARTLAGRGVGGGRGAARDAEVILHEAEDTVGGRVRSEVVDGFTLDLGFQVYLSAYERAGRVFDLKSLDMRSFAAGAVVHRGADACVLADPLRETGRAIGGAVHAWRSGYVGVRDALALARLVIAGDSAFKPGTTAEDALRNAGVTDGMLEGFFRPFFGGVFFDRSLQTDAAMLGFTFDHFRRGRACVPARGMGAMTQQLASRCMEQGVHVHTATRVAAIETGGVALENGERIDADAVVVATEGDAAGTLIRSLDPDRAARMAGRAWRTTRSLWFAVDRASLGDTGGRGILHLDGTGGAVGSAGPVNHLAVMTDVAPGYGSGDGRALVCANTVDTEGADAAVVEAARGQLDGWFRGRASGWDLLKVHTIPRALPGQSVSEGGVPRGRDGFTVSEGVYLAGDHLTSASIEGAVMSGLEAAEAVLSGFDEMDGGGGSAGGGGEGGSRAVA